MARRPGTGARAHKGAGPGRLLPQPREVGALGWPAILMRLLIDRRANHACGMGLAPNGGPLSCTCSSQPGLNHADPEPMPEMFDHSGGCTRVFDSSTPQLDCLSGLFTPLQVGGPGHFGAAVPPVRAARRAVPAALPAAGSGSRDAVPVHVPAEASRCAHRCRGRSLEGRVQNMLGNGPPQGTGPP